MCPLYFFGQERVRKSPEEVLGAEMKVVIIKKLGKTWEEIIDGPFTAG